MGKVWKNARIFAGGADLTAMANKIELKPDAEEKDVTNYGSGGWKESIIGLYSAALTGGGQWQAGDTSLVDDALWADLTAGAVVPWTIGPDTADVGALSYGLKATDKEYGFGGAVGDVAAWNAGAACSGPTARGSFLHPPGTARTVTGSGTAVQLGALTATQRLHVNLHVLSVSGTDTPTLTVIVESDDGSGFASATTRGTFTAATARGGQTLTVDGAVTDDYWRVGWTISGTNPSFLFVAAAGIVPV